MGALSSNWRLTAKVEEPERRQRALPRQTMEEWAAMMGGCVHCSYQQGVKGHAPKCPARPGGPVVTVKRDVQRGLARAAKAAAAAKRGTFGNGIRVRQ